MLLDKKMSLLEKRTLLSNKLSKLYTENLALVKDNEKLMKDNLKLNTNIREMNPGFTSNTSNSFPMITEIQIKINDYIKIICQDVFFDLLLPSEINIKGIILFYKTFFQKIEEVIQNYFSPLESQIKETLKITDQWKPIANVLKKTYQYNWKAIYSNIEKNINFVKILKDLKKNLFSKDNLDDDIDKNILEFAHKTYEIVFMCYICDPEIFIDVNQMGNYVYFNSVTHDPIDGFIKPTQSSFIILPAFYKGLIPSKNTMIVKSQVIAEDYFPIH